MKRIKTVPVALCSFLAFCLTAQNVSASKFIPSQSLALAEDFLAGAQTSGLEKEQKETISDNSMTDASTSKPKSSKRKKKGKSSKKGKGRSKSKKHSKRKKNSDLGLTDSAR
jgi:hypothetical protein